MSFLDISLSSAISNDLFCLQNAINDFNFSTDSTERSEHKHGNKSNDLQPLNATQSFDIKYGKHKFCTSMLNIHLYFNPFFSDLDVSFEDMLSSKMLPKENSTKISPIE